MRSARELFDIEADPRETRNLAASEAAALATMAAAMDRWLAAFPRRATRAPLSRPVDLETLEQLESLGYVGGTRNR